MQRHARNQIIGISLVVLYLGVMVVGGVDTITGYLTTTSSECGNYVCEVEENYATCPEDCVGTCGDNICEEEETYTCVMDCEKARSAKIEEKAFHVGAVWMIFAASIALLFIGIAVLAKPRRVRKRRRKRRSSRRK